MGLYKVVLLERISNSKCKRAALAVLYVIGFALISTLGAALDRAAGPQSAPASEQTPDEATSSPQKNATSGQAVVEGERHIVPAIEGAAPPVAQTLPAWWDAVGDQAALSRSKTEREEEPDE